MKLEDLSSPLFYADPYPTYQELREMGRIVSLKPGLWFSGDYSLIDALLRDKRVGKALGQSLRVRYGEALAQAPMFKTLERMLLVMNPPNHTRLRKLLAKAFNARQIAEFKALVQSTADRLVDGFAKRGSADLMEEFALVLPVEVICAMLGVPAEDGRMFVKAVNAIAKALDMAPMTENEIIQGNEATKTLEEYFAAVIEQRRGTAQSDLISTLLSVNEDGEYLSQEEIIANMILMFMAGFETTTNMVCNALISLHRHPDELAKVNADLSLIPAAVAEALRHDSSVQMTGRAAFEDLEIDGLKIPQGSLLFLSIGAGNRDPNRFAEPEKFIVGRQDLDGYGLSFGGGIHNCLGMRLAIVELEVALRTLLVRLPGMRLVNLNDLPWRPRNTLRGVESLIAAWN